MSRTYLVFAAFLLLFAFFAVVLGDDGFTSETNLLNIVRQTAPVTVMAVAAVFVLSVGEIDLSIGSVVALSALVTAKVLQTEDVALAVGAGLGVGLGVGAMNGFFVTVLRLPSFLVTLASLGIVAGLARTITDLQAVAVANDSFVNVFGSGDVGPIPGWRSGRSARLRSGNSRSATPASARTWSRRAIARVPRAWRVSASIGSASPCSF